MKSLRLVSCIFLITGILSCKKNHTAQFLPGTWVTSEMTYVYSDTIIPVTDVDQRWEFDGYDYSLYDHAVLSEAGTYVVNFSGTRIHFFNDNGNSTMEVLDMDETLLQWRTKQVSPGMYIEMELEKIQ